MHKSMSLKYEHPHPRIHNRRSARTRNSQPPHLRQPPELEQLLHRNVQRFRGGLVFKAHGSCVSLNSRPESNKEEEAEAKPIELICLGSNPSRFERKRARSHQSFEPRYLLQPPNFRRARQTYEREAGASQLCPLPSEEGTTEKGSRPFLPESQGQNLALSDLYVPYFSSSSLLLPSLELSGAQSL